MIWSFGLLCGKHYKGLAYPKNDITILWKKLLFNQFHDILAGTSITRVNEEAVASFDEIQAKAKQLEANAFKVLTNDKAENCMTVYNSLSWQRDELVALPEGYFAAYDINGNELYVQQIEGKAFTKATIPPMGFTTIKLAKKDVMNKPADGSFAYSSGGLVCLENEHIRLSFNNIGQIEEIFDKETHSNLASGLCNNFKMYKDINIEYDAWELGTMYKAMPIALEAPGEINYTVRREPDGIVCRYRNKTANQSFEFEAGRYP